MNTRPTITSTLPPPTLSATFNAPPPTRFTTTTDTGFQVYSTSTCTLLVSRTLSGGLAHATLLDTTNYLALVGGGRSPHFTQTKVIIWDDIKSKPAISLDHKTAVLRVKLTRTHVAVALQNSVHLYTFASPPKRIAVFETADNHLGLLCLGSNHVLFPGRSPGKIQLVELAGSNNVSIIPAHSGALRALELSPDGTLLASASETGTLIRVFATANCAKLAELRRGVDQAFIYSIAISPDGMSLAVTSDKFTLHVFDLSQLPGRAPTPAAGTGSSATGGSPAPRKRSQSPQVAGADDDEKTNKWGILSKLPLLPRVFSDTYSFASAPFNVEDDTTASAGQAGTSEPAGLPPLGSIGVNPMKGQLGWLDDGTIIVLSAGRDGKWERFRLGERVERIGGREETRRVVWRDGWKRVSG